jgi:hypothetical protein
MANPQLWNQYQALGKKHDDHTPIQTAAYAVSSLIKCAEPSSEHRRPLSITAILLTTPSVKTFSKCQKLLRSVIAFPVSGYTFVGLSHCRVNVDSAKYFV